MSAAAKVGAFTIGGLMMLGAAIFTLGNFNFSSDDDLVFYANFKQVLGLSPKADVRLNGVPIGKVEDLVSDAKGVTVVLRVKDDVKIPTDSKIMVTGIGVMGEKFVNIIPSSDNGEYIKSGNVMFGQDEVGMNLMFENLNKVMDKVEKLLGEVQAIIGNDTLQKSVVLMSENMKEASEHISGMTAAMERMAVNNEGNINSMIEQMNGTLESVGRSMASVERITGNLENVAGDPQLAEDLKSTLKNISDTTKNVAHMAENMDKFAGDPKVAEDLKATVHNARKSDKVSDIEVTPSVDVMYSGGASNWNANFNLDITSGDTSLDLGAEHIGDGTKLNAQVGKKFGTDFGARAGIIAGKPGIGIDAYAGDKWKFSAEAYDLNNVKVRLKSQYKISNSTYLLGEWHDINHKDERAAYIGIRQEF